MTYKIGDKVRLLEKLGGRAEVGDIGVVKRVAGSSFEVDFPAQAGYAILKKHVELVKEEAVVPTTVKKTKARRELSKPAEALDVHTILGQDKIHQQLEIAVDKNLPVLLVGDTGTGKTTIVKEVADKHKQPWIRFNLTGETTVDEFVGKYTLSDKKTVWEDGVLLQAMKSGKWLIVDEVNVALPEILFVLHSLLDDERAVMVASHNGEVVTPHKDFRFFGTMNPVDEYAGTKDLNKAFKSRFGMILNMNYPEPKIESKIVSGKSGINLDVAAQIVDVGQKIRRAKEANEVFYTCSTRDLIQWATLTSVLELKDAFEVTILNKANGDKEHIVKIYNQVIGDYQEAIKKGYQLNIEFYIDEANKLEKAKKDFENSKAKIENKIREEILVKLLANKDMKTA